MKQTRYLVVILLAMLLVAFSGCSSKKVKDGDGVGGTPGITDAAGRNDGTGVDGQGINGDGDGTGGNSGGAFPQQRVVYFDYDKDEIRGDARGILEAHAAYLTSRPANIRLEGHADERGSREYNLALGESRAEAVKRTLSILGVPESQMNTLTYGEEQPIDPGHNETSWQLNRRVEIIYP